jgi:DNA-binding NtrC family response regulator
MKILVIEEALEERQLLKKQLSLLGHTVTECADAETALELYQRSDFPVVMVDLDLSGMNGLEFCHRVQALPQRAKSVIIVTIGRERSEDVQLALEAGANDYLITPISFARLQARFLVFEQQLREISEYYQTREKLERLGEGPATHFPELPPAGKAQLSEAEEQDEDVEEAEADDDTAFYQEPTSLTLALEAFEKHFLRQVLTHNGWDKQKTAEQLDIPLRILLRKMKKHDVFPREHLHS